MRLLFHDRAIPELLILLICFGFSEETKPTKKSDEPSKESKSTFITIRIPANVATHNQDCMYEGVVRHHGDAWSPGPCIPECRCKHGHVKCSKLECPDLNCDKPIKKKWKCCPECLPEMQNGTCGVWTKGGNANGGCCVFPFAYNGVMHYTCTYLDHNQPWCSISMNYDRDGVWGECIDNGDSHKALRFKDHKGKAYQQDNTDEIVSSIANNVANNLTNQTAGPEQNTSNPNPMTPESNETTPTGNATEPLPAAIATNASSAVLPAATGVVPTAAASPSVQPSPEANATEVLPAPTSIPSPSPSAGVSVVPQASGSVQPGGGASVVPQASGSVQLGGGASVPVASNQTVPVLGTTVAVAPSSQPAASPAAPQPGQSVVPGQPGAVQTSSLGVTAAGITTPLLPGPVPEVAQQPAPQPTQQPAPQLTLQPAPQPTELPAPQPTQLPAPQPAEQPAPQPVEQPAPQPTELPAPQPVPGPSPAEGAIPGYPFPISQTTLTQGQTQAPGPQPGQAVHQLTTTEINANHNISTTDYWFGKPNETLNRTNEVANQAEQVTGGAGNQQAVDNETTGGNETVSNQTINDSYNTAQGNQASYGYQAASSPNYYQNQNPATYMDQPSSSQGGYPSYNTQGYNDNTAYQGYNGYDKQNTAYDNTGYQRNTGYDNTGYQRNTGYDNTGYQRNSGYDNTDYQRNSGYDNTAYQQYGESQVQNTAGQASYYSNEQQYQNDGYPGSYYTG